MQLALVGGGFADPPIVIPWWVFFTSIAIVYNSPDLEFCYIGVGITFMIQLFVSLFVSAIQEVREIDSLEEYFDKTHPDITFSYPYKPYPQIIPEEVDAFWTRIMRDILSTLLPDAARDFEGRETESNWVVRERTITRMRQELPTLEPDIKSLWLSQIRTMLDGLLKTANSLRTTVSTTGCLLFQDIAKEYGSGIDGMVEILLQNFIKLCANTKLITRINANDTVLTIIGHVSYHIRIVQHIHSACQDKNVQPRKFACEWLKKVIKRHPRSTIEHHGGLDLIEKSIKLGLEDRDKNVREAMRPTYWNFARRWPERSEVMFSSLDKTKQDQLLADPSNPNLTVPATSTQANSEINVSQSAISAPPKIAMKDPEAQPLPRKVEQYASGDFNASADKFPSEAPASTTDSNSQVTTSKPSLKDIKAQMRKAHNSREDPHVTTEKAYSEAQLSKTDTVPPGSRNKPTLKEIKSALKIAQNAHNDKNISTSDTIPEVAVAQKVTQISIEDTGSVKDQAQNEAQVLKIGTISAAPVRRKKTPTAKFQQSQSKVPENDAQNLTAQTEAPENEAADASPVEREAMITKSVESDAAAIPYQPTLERSNPQMTAETFESEREKRKRANFLAVALEKLSARDMDVECFRILQDRLKQDCNSPVWKALILPLCEWLETPKMPEEMSESLNWQDEQYYALSTLRLLLSNKLWGPEYYTRIMLTLTVANAWYKRKSFMVVGIRHALNFIINHCNVLECLQLSCQVLENEHEETEDEIKILALGAMLHRIHSHPQQESEFYHLLASEAEMANRLARIGSAALESEVASIRKAAISYAQEFWHLVPEDEYFDLMAGGDEKTQNLLRYYINRHRRIDDHVEL